MQGHAVKLAGSNRPSRALIRLIHHHASSADHTGDEMVLNVITEIARGAGTFVTNTYGRNVVDKLLESDVPQCIRDEAARSLLTNSTIPNLLNAQSRLGRHALTGLL